MYYIDNSGFQEFLPLRNIVFGGWVWEGELVGWKKGSWGAYMFWICEGW